MTVDNGFKVNVDWRVGELGRGISNPKCFGLNITNSILNVISRAVQFSSKKKIKKKKKIQQAKVEDGIILISDCGYRLI